MSMRKLRASALHAQRAAGNLIRTQILRSDFVPPQVAVYHANYHCNAGCSFCSRAQDIATAALRREIGLEEIEVIFREVRKLVSSIYVAGGEPLLQRNIEDILRLAREIGFFPVVVNTNATILDQRPQVLKYADTTVVSIHTANVRKAASIFRIRDQLAQRAFDNIRSAAREARVYGNKVVGNCVLTTDNLSSSYEVLSFCLEHDIPIAFVPAIEDFLPNIASADENKLREYRDFLNLVIRTKKQSPKAIQGTLRYLERIRDLGSFDCRPTSIISINPDGELVNPCDHKYRGLPEHLGQIGHGQSVSAILARHIDRREAFRPCDKNCLKACYAEPALANESLLAAALEFLPF